MSIRHRWVCFEEEKTTTTSTTTKPCRCWDRADLTKQARLDMESWTPEPGAWGPGWGEWRRKMVSYERRDSLSGFCKRPIWKKTTAVLFPHMRYGRGLDKLLRWSSWNWMKLMEKPDVGVLRKLANPLLQPHHLQQSSGLLCYVPRPCRQTDISKHTGHLSCFCERESRRQGILSQIHHRPIPLQVSAAPFLRLSQTPREAITLLPSLFQHLYCI